VSVAKDQFQLADLNTITGCASKAGNPINDANPLPSPPQGSVDFFLDFGGWLNAPAGDFTRGDAQYLRDYFSPYDSLINPAIDPVNPGDTTAPFTPGGNPVIYAEAEWGGVYTRISQQNDLSDFAPGLTAGASGSSATLDSRFDRLLVVNFYLFYPLTDNPPATPQAPSSPPLMREGQWECVSLYFGIDPSNITPGMVNPATYVRPEIGALPAEPAFAVYSRGVNLSGDGSAQQPTDAYPASASIWSQVPTSFLGIETNTSTNPVVFVSCGTHKNFFEPQFINEHLPFDAGLGALSGGIGIGSGVSGGLAGASGIGVSVPAAGAVTGATVLAATGIGLIILAVFLFLLAIIIVIAAADEHSAIPVGAENDFAPGGVPIVPGGTQANPVNPQTQAGVITPWPGAPAIAAIGALYNMVFCNRFDPTGQCAPPAWWDYPGRWGVKVTSDITSDWDNGSRRVDSFGRSRGYWNALALQRSGLL
jgi:hypothetical protein